MRRKRIVPDVGVRETSTGANKVDKNNVVRLQRLSMNEPRIAINGFALSEGQAMTVRVAIQTFLSDMAADDALGNDEHGRSMRANYTRMCGELNHLMRASIEFEGDDVTQELQEANRRLEEFHEILDRKNTIIRLLTMGDCTAEELRLSDAAGLDTPGAQNIPT